MLPMRIHVTAQLLTAFSVLTQEEQVRLQPKSRSNCNNHRFTERQQQWQKQTKSSDDKRNKYQPVATSITTAKGIKTTREDKGTERDSPSLGLRICDGQKNKKNKNNCLFQKCVGKHRKQKPAAKTQERGKKIKAAWPL